MSPVTVRVDADEMYPVYSATAGGTQGFEVEVDREQLARWEAAAAAWETAQEEIGALYEAASEAEEERKALERAEREAAEKAERARRAQEQREAQAAREEARRAMWEQIEASGGVVYNANGQPIGTLKNDRHGVRLEP